MTATTLPSSGSLNPIDVSKLVKVNPNVLSSGIGVNIMNGLILTTNLPTGTFKYYTNYADALADFGATSTEAGMAQIYFSGYDGAENTPGKLYFANPDGLNDNNSSDYSSSVMDLVVEKIKDFSGFTTAYQLNTAQLLDFAKWTDAQNGRYWFIGADATTGGSTDPSENPTQSFGYNLTTNNLNGTTAIYGDANQFNVAAFCLGWMASLDFSQTNGRTNLALRSNALLSPFTDSYPPYLANIEQAGNYNMYSAYANGLGRWNLLYPGSVSGPFKWADSYVNQIWINASIQAALLNLLLTQNSIPYNAEGDALISSAVSDVMRQALNFGAIRTGIQLSDQEKQSLKQSVGTDISGAITNTGYYIQSNASNTPAVDRAARKSPPIKVFYADGESIQSININSVEVQ